MPLPVTAKSSFPSLLGRCRLDGIADLEKCSDLPFMVNVLHNSFGYGKGWCASLRIMGPARPVVFFFCNFRCRFNN